MNLALSQIFQALSKPLKWWVIIAPWERGVRVRMGKSAKELQPGPHFRIPFLDRVYVQTIRLRTISTSNLTVMTQNGISIVISYAISFAIRDIVLLYNSVQNPEETIRSLISGALVHCAATEEFTVVDHLISAVETKMKERVAGFSSWGLADISCRLTAFTKSRVYRIVSNEYQTGTGLGDVDDRARER